MEKQKNNSKYTLPEQVGKLLESGRYKDCFTLLRRKLTENPLSGFLNRISLLETTYKYLLEYYAKGVEDPGRDSILMDIRYQLNDIGQRIEKESNASDSSEIYYSTLRMSRLRPIDIDSCISQIMQLKAMADLALSSGQYPDSVMSRIESEEERLFNAIWIADTITAENFTALASEIKSGNLPLTTSALCIAASGLSLMRFYSREAMLFLCAVASAEDNKISARAISTLLIALSKWQKIVTDDRQAMDSMATLLEIDGMPEKIRNVVKTIIHTRDTDRVARKMQREVIPGLMHFGPDILQRLKKSSEEASFSDLESNPEWEELLKNSGIEDKLRELTEMQTDGADVMMVPFSNLKGFPFFRQLRNWFLPFTLRHPMLKPLDSIDNDGLSSMLEMNGLMCDSDKYSFAFSLLSMPDAQRKMVVSQMSAQAIQMKEQMEQIDLFKTGKEFSDELTIYIRDLYRFHKLFPKRTEFFDPFATAYEFTTIPMVQNTMESDEDIAAVAEFYFKRGYYSDALPLLQKVARSSSAPPHIWEKIGFCLEKQPNGNAGAIEAYMKAQLFNPDSNWIAKRLGICYRRASDYRNAVEYLNMAKPADGSFDRSLSLLIADTLAEGCKWEDALKELYRVDYENPDDPDVIRRMARCAFRAGNLTKSEEWLKSIPNISFSEEDFRMLGHIAFLKNDLKEAIRLYRLTVRPNDEKRIWKSEILSDIDILEGLGATRSTLLLLLESLAYSIE